MNEDYDRICDEAAVRLIDRHQAEYDDIVGRCKREFKKHGGFLR